MTIATGPLIEFYRKDGFSRVITFKFNDEAVSISGYTGYFTVKKNLEDSTPLISKSLSITSAEEGTFSLVLTGAETDIEVYQGYYYDIEITPSGGQPITARGRLNVYQGVRD